MKDALASDSPRESYVVEIDGVPQFELPSVRASTLRRLCSLDTTFRIARVKLRAC